RGHRRRADEQGRQRSHRRLEIRGGRQGGGLARTAGEGISGGIGCFLPLSRWTVGSRGGSGNGRHPARWVDARQGRDRGGGRARAGDGLHRRAPFPALTGMVERTPSLAVRLRPATAEDGFLIRRWLKDPAVAACSGNRASAEAEIALARLSATALMRIVTWQARPIGYAQALEVGLRSGSQPLEIPAGSWDTQFWSVPSPI